MQLRSGRCLLYPPLVQQGDHHHCQSGHCAEGRISNLPEDLLLKILTHLRSSDEVARAGAVSRSWRDLWTKLPELTFSIVHPLSVQSALTRITRSSLDLLDITFYVDSYDDEDWHRRVSLLLHDAAQLLPKKLIVSVLVGSLKEYDVELPCFEHTSFLSLVLTGCLQITLPQAGVFTALKNLYLESCCIDISALLSLCPCLRILNIKDLKGVDKFIVHSPLLEEIVLDIESCDMHRIDIAAPMLKEATLRVDIAKSFILSFSAPMLKKLEWGYFYRCVHVVFGQIWKVLGIIERKLEELYVVKLIMRSCVDVHNNLDTEWSIAQVIAQLPVIDFSILELDVETQKHAFGPLMSRLLQIQPSIKRLSVVLAWNQVQVACLANCPCEQPSNWRSEDISVANLEVVEIYGLQGEDDEVDFLKLILRCATVLRRVTVSISDDVSPSDSVYEKVCSTLKEYPDVECHIMASESEGVVYS